MASALRSHRGPSTFTELGGLRDQQTFNTILLRHRNCFQSIYYAIETVSSLYRYGAGASHCYHAVSAPKTIPDGARFPITDGHRFNPQLSDVSGPQKVSDFRQNSPALRRDERISDREKARSLVWLRALHPPMIPLPGSNEDLAARVDHCLLQPNRLLRLGRMD